MKIGKPVVFALSALLALSACGSSATAPSGTTSTSASEKTKAAALPPGYHPVTDFTGYIGGHKGPAKTNLPPVYIGIINQQGGSSDIAPEWTIGAQIAAKYINKDAGGIDGHPLKLVPCFIPDKVARAAQCGQKMANDPHVKAISIGPVAIGNQAMEAPIEPTGKVMAFGISVNGADSVAKNAYVLFGDGTHIEAPLATFAKKHLHAKTVSILYENLPGNSVGASIIANALKYEGVRVNIVGYDPSTTDLSGPIIDAKAATADLFIADAPDSAGCAEMYKALKKLSITTPVLANGPCVSRQTATAEGGHLPPDWYYAAAGPLPGDPVDPSYPDFGKVAAQFHQSKWTNNDWVAKSFGQFLAVARWENQVLASGKPLTAANVNAVAKAYRGAVPFGAPKLVCGTLPGAPAVCNDKVTFYKNTSPGVFMPVAWWLPPPPGYHIPAADR